MKFCLSLHSLDDLRSDDLARSAPGGETVENKERAFLSKGRVPVSLIHEVVYALLLFRHCEESVGDDGLVKFLEGGRRSGCCSE